VRAAAEARYVLGDLPGAIDRLRAAQQVSRSGAAAGAGQDFIEASVIDARLRAILAQRRQQQLDARNEGRPSRTGDRTEDRTGDDGAPPPPQLTRP
jgi:beta-barrel assembly-enhancing protease